MADFDAIYNQVYNSLPDVEAKLKEMQQSDIDALTKQRDVQDKRLQEERDETLRQAYVTQEMNKRDLPAMMAAQGLTGGITESAANDLLRDYRNSANAARKTYTNAYTDLSTTYDTNVASLNSAYAQKIMDALAQRRAEAMQKSQIAYQIRQAEEAAWAAQQASGPIVPTSGTGGGSGGGGGENSGKTPAQIMYESMIRVLPYGNTNAGAQGQANTAAQKYTGTPAYVQPQSTFGYTWK